MSRQEFLEKLTESAIEPLPRDALDGLHLTDSACMIGNPSESGTLLAQMGLETHSQELPKPAPENFIPFEPKGALS